MEVDMHGDERPDSDVNFLNLNESRALVYSDYPQGTARGFSEWHQPWTLSIEHGQDLWQLPPAPRSHPDYKSLGELYERNIAKLEENLRCPIEYVLPTPLSKTTPFSLAMLLRLKCLSNDYKGSLEGFQTLLLDEWRARLARLGLKEDTEKVDLVRVDVNSVKPQPHGKRAEKHIQENIYGLSLGDVRDIRARLLAVPRKKRFAAGNAMQLEAGEGMAKNTSSINKHKASPPDRNRTKKAKFAKFEEFKNQAAAITEHPENLIDAVDAMAEEEPTEAKGKIFKRAQYVGDLLSKQMNGAFEADESNGVQKKFKRNTALKTKLRKREVGGAQPLPFEQMQFGSIPTLYSQSTEGKQEAILSGMERMGLGLAAQKPLPDDLGSDDQQEGGVSLG